MQLIGCCRFPALQHLDISACRRVSNEELANLPKMPNLRGVVLAGCEDISDEGMLHLAQITRLTALNMSNCCKVRAVPTAHHATGIMENITSVYIWQAALAGQSSAAPSAGQCLT